LELRTAIRGDVPSLVRTDAKRLQQVLKNLLANAIKFTEEGRVELEVLRARSGWRPGRAVLDSADAVVAFQVRDTGIGIARENLERIFDAFHQAESGIDRRYGGTGLGLAISREIAFILGADLVVES